MLVCIHRRQNDANILEEEEEEEEEEEKEEEAADSSNSRRTTALLAHYYSVWFKMTSACRINFRNRLVFILQVYKAQKSLHIYAL